MTTDNSPKIDAAAGSACSGHHTPPADTATDDLSVCLVMAGTPVVKSIAEAQGLYRDYEGQRYYFCCGACGPLFDADPAKYASAA
ncbi:MAG: YHS domain-containing protein [Homoserinimonas sp.]